jgi:hypothetical protein
MVKAAIVAYRFDFIQENWLRGRILTYDFQVTSFASRVTEADQAMTPIHVRIFAGLCILGLVTWLALSSSGKERRIAALNEALASNRIGKIDENERRSVEQVIDEMLRANNIQASVAVNKQFDPRRLNIYVTSSSAEAVTRCGAGNALYDAELDAIFIDEQFFSRDGFRSIVEASSYSAVLGFRDDLEFPKVYARFVLLHELGHRQLHRYRPRGRRDLNAGSAEVDNIERQADRFAVQAMEKFYAYDREHLRLVSQPLIDLIGGSSFFGPNVSPETQVYVDLAGTLFVMSVFNFYLNTPYSPFFTDRLHPSFLDRAQGAIDAILERPALNQQLRGNLRSLRASLTRTMRIGQLPFKEILVPAPISDVAFGSDRLLILGLQNDRLFEVPNTGLTRHDTDGSTRVITAKVLWTETQTGTTDRNGAFWARPDGTLLQVDGEGEVWEFKASARAPRSLRLPAPFTTRSCFRIALPPQPTEYAIASVCDEAGVSWLLVLRNDELLAMRSHSDILAEIGQKFGRPLKDFEIVAIDNENLHLAASTEGSPVRLAMRATFLLRR